MIEGILIRLEKHKGNFRHEWNIIEVKRWVDYVYGIHSSPFRKGDFGVWSCWHP